MRRGATRHLYRLLRVYQVDHVDHSSVASYKQKECNLDCIQFVDMTQFQLKILSVYATLCKVKEDMKINVAVTCLVTSELIMSLDGWAIFFSTSFSR